MKFIGSSAHQYIFFSLEVFMKIAVSKALNKFCTLSVDVSLDTNMLFLGCFHMFQTDNPDGAH